MLLLDENIPENQRQLLKSWNIAVRQIGVDFSHKGIKDNDILSLLHSHSRITFFTRDKGLFQKTYCHSNYSIVVLFVGQYESASFIRRVIKHPALNSFEKRKGKIIRISHSVVGVFTKNFSKEKILELQ